jgi:AcrR family transcriptional regulator
MAPTIDTRATRVDSHPETSSMPKRERAAPRKLPRQTRSKATVDAIVTAAARILVRDGYQGANVNTIAELAGVGVGSLYQYFPSKEAVVAAVIKRHSDQMIEVFQDGLAALAFLPMPAACRGIVRRALLAYAVDPRLRAVIVEEVPDLVAFAKSRDFDDTLAFMLRGYFVFHADRIRPKNVDLAVKIVATAAEAAITRVIVDHPELVDSEELIDEITALILGYVAAPGAA